MSTTSRRDFLEEFLESRRKTERARSRIEELRAKELDPLLAHTGRGKEMPWELPDVREWFLDLLSWALTNPYHEGLAFFAMRKTVHAERVMGRFAAMADVMHDDDIPRDWPVYVKSGSEKYEDYAVDIKEEAQAAG